MLPKLHIMEEHVVPWVKRWRVRAGLMGEQDSWVSKEPSPYMLISRGWSEFIKEFQMMWTAQVHHEGAPTGVRAITELP